MRINITMISGDKAPGYGIGITENCFEIDNSSDYI